MIYSGWLVRSETGSRSSNPFYWMVTSTIWCQPTSSTCHIVTVGDGDCYILTPQTPCSIASRKIQLVKMKRCTSSHSPENDVTEWLKCVTKSNHVSTIIWLHSRYPQHANIHLCFGGLITRVKVWIQKGYQHLAGDKPCPCCLTSFWTPNASIPCLSGYNVNWLTWEVSSSKVYK